MVETNVASWRTEPNLAGVDQVTSREIHLIGDNNEATNYCARRYELGRRCCRAGVTSNVRRHLATTPTATGEGYAKGILDRAGRHRRSREVQGLHCCQCRAFQEVRRALLSARGSLRKSRGDQSLPKCGDRVSHLSGCPRLLEVTRVPGGTQAASARVNHRSHHHRGYDGPQPT